MINKLFYTISLIQTVWFSNQSTNNKQLRVHWCGRLVGWLYISCTRDWKYQQENSCSNEKPHIDSNYWLNFLLNDDDHSSNTMYAFSYTIRFQTISNTKHILDAYTDLQTHMYSSVLGVLVCSVNFLPNILNLCYAMCILFL